MSKGFFNMSFQGELGAGAAGVVYRAKHKTDGGDFAVKTIDISDHKRKDHLLMEVMVRKELIIIHCNKIFVHFPAK